MYYVVVLNAGKELKTQRYLPASFFEAIHGRSVCFQLKFEHTVLALNSTQPVKANIIL